MCAACHTRHSTAQLPTTQSQKGLISDPMNLQHSQSEPLILSGRGVTAVLGPTNTGKTHSPSSAWWRMSAA